MQTITVKIEVPDGVLVRVRQGTSPDDGQPASEPVHDYFHHFLSDNGRRIYRAAAQVERETGPDYTFDDIAGEAGLQYESAKSMHRSTGRPAKRWRDERGAPEPIRLEKLAYEWDELDHVHRMHYSLPDGIAELLEGW